eukprot:167269_1
MPRRSYRIIKTELFSTKNITMATLSADKEVKESKEDNIEETNSIISTDWLSIITSQLQERDLREKIPFENISLSYNLLLDENVDLSKRVTELSQALLQLKQDNWNRPSLMSNIDSNENDNNKKKNKMFKKKKKKKNNI